MSRENMIEFLIDNESVEDLKKDLKMYFEQVEKAKQLIYINYFDEKTGKWLDEAFKQLYYILDFNNSEI